MPEQEVVERTAEEKAQMYAAILGSVSVITNTLDDDNDFCSDLDAAGKKEPVSYTHLTLPTNREV